MLSFDPIHDGLCRHAACSVGALEFEQHRPSGADLRQDLFRVGFGASSWVKEGEGDREPQQQRAQRDEVSRLSAVAQQHDRQHK